jgi:hypothetical protein
MVGIVVLVLVVVLVVVVVVVVNVVIVFVAVLPRLKKASIYIFFINESMHTRGLT